MALQNASESSLKWTNLSRSEPRRPWITPCRLRYPNMRLTVVGDTPSALLQLNWWLSFPRKWESRLIERLGFRIKCGMTTPRIISNRALGPDSTPRETSWANRRVEQRVQIVLDIVSVAALSHQWLLCSQQPFSRPPFRLGRRNWRSVKDSCEITSTTVQIITPYWSNVKAVLRFSGMSSARLYAQRPANGLMLSVIGRLWSKEPQKPFATEGEKNPQKPLSQQISFLASYLRGENVVWRYPSHICLPLYALQTTTNIVCEFCYLGVCPSNSWIHFG